MECYQNGKRFTFRQNDDILRASSIIGGDTDGKSIELHGNINIKKATALARIELLF